MSTEGGEPPDGGQVILAAEMTREYRQWRVATIFYGIAYHASRVVLILASAIVAAKATLAEGQGRWLVDWVPLLAVLVAVLTALDTWLKPQQKWRGFMESRDELADLRVRMAGGLAVDAVRAEFRRLRERHRELNVF